MIFAIANKMKPTKLFCCALIAGGLMLSPFTAAAQNYLADVMTIAGGWAKATPPDSQTTAVYMTILNNSDNDDNFIGAKTPLADKVEIRDSYHQNALMTAVPIKPSDAVTFKPGGIHLVLIGLKRQLLPREKIPVTFIFEKATAVTTDVTVMTQDSKLPLDIDQNNWQ